MARLELTPFVMHDSQAAARRVKDNGGDLEAQFRAACVAAKDHWMVTDPNEQFVGAVAGFQAIQDEETKTRIIDECRAIGHLNAILHASQVGLSVSLDGLADAPEHPIGLFRIWREVNES